MPAAFSFMNALRAARRPVASALLVTFILSPYGALAQTVPDIGAAPQHQPSVTTFGSVPVVDIVAPDATGLSHNKWQGFDVPNQGTVLNNATTATTSQLVGAINANSRLQGTAARLILNEVTGNQPSQLLGTLEVAGAAAKVVIANPNGITCDGCGFVNTPHVQLTTGRPDFSSGALRFDVTGGQIDIGANGLSALATRLDLIALAVRTQGAIAAQSDINVLAGRFYADAETLALSDAGRDSAGPHPSTDWDSFAIDIGQSVSAGSIQLITEGSHIGVRTAAPITATGDFTLASRAPMVLDATVNAGRDIGIYNVGAWNSTIAGVLAATRDLQMIAMDVTVAASGALVSTHGKVELGFVGDNSDAYTQFINNGRIIAAGDITLSGLLGGLNTGTIDAGGTLEAVAGSISSKSSVDGLPGTFGTSFYSFFGNNGVALVNTGTLTAGHDVFLNLIENDGGNVVAGRDAFVWQAQRGRYTNVYDTPTGRAGSLTAEGDLFLFAPNNGDSFTAPGTQTFFAHNDLFLVAEADRFAARGAMRDEILADLANAAPADAARYINRDTLIANRDMTVALPSGFENQNTLQARDIRIAASEVVNTPRIDTRHEQVSDERFSGCKTKYAGICSADIETPKSGALITAARHIVIDSASFRNDGATVLAGGNIDIATNDFLNQDRSYGARWQSVYSETPNALLLSYAAPDGSGTVPQHFGEVWWIKHASGTTALGTLPGNIQAGGAFSVDSYPRTQAPTLVTTPDPAPTPAPPVATPEAVSPLSQTVSAIRNPPVVSTSAQQSGTGASAAAAAPTSTAPSRFINTGNITAAAIVVKADDIRNGFDAAKDYYHRTAAPQLPPSRIDIAGYGSTASTRLPSGAYSGEALMRILPPHLASSAPFALNPAEEHAALRNALLATTGRGWILPGLTWDAATGQSPEQQQHAILAANGAAFAIEQGIPAGTALSATQRAKLTAPVLWYVNTGGMLDTHGLPA